MKKFFVYLFALSFSFFCLCGCLDVVKSQFLSGNSECRPWSGMEVHPTEMQKVMFGVQNDSDSFYIILSVKDVDLMDKISRHGLELWIDTVRKKNVPQQKRLAVVSGPVREDPPPPPEQGLPEKNFSKTPPVLLIASNEKKRGTPGNLLEPHCVVERHEKELILKYSLPFDWIRQNLKISSLTSLMMGFVVNERLDMLDFNEATMLKPADHPNSEMGGEGARPPMRGGEGQGMEGGGGPGPKRGGGRGYENGMREGPGGPPPGGADSSAMQKPKRQMSMRGEIPVLTAQELWIKVKSAKID